MKLDKLRSIREGHRRTISSRLEELEAAKDDSSRTKFNTLLKSIEDKLEQIKTLNEKILDATEVTEVEEEITQADEIVVQVQIKVNQYRESGKSQRADNSNEDISIQCTGEEFGRSEPEIYRVEQAHTSSSQQGPGEIRTSVPSDSLYTGFVPQTVSISSSFSHSRLPKLALPIFGGKLLEWQTFWDSYVSAVHSNPTLTDVQKFNYLKSQLDGEAARAISGFTMTNANYATAVNLLKERFGQTHKITNAYMQALLQIPSPRQNLHSLRSFNDQMEAYIRGLEALGQCQENYGALLVPVLLGKLPAEIRKNLARVNGSDNWLLGDLRTAICKELNIMEAGQSSEIPEVHEPTASFFTGTNPRNRHNNQKHRQFERGTTRNTYTNTCVFCAGSHSSTDCRKVQGYNSRMQIVKRNRLCFNCLGQHQVSACTSNSRCKACKRKHHTSICSLNQTTNRAPDHNSNMANYQPVNEQTDRSSGTIIHAHTIQSRREVLLKTAIAPICTHTYCTDANILFDEGSQRSFITEMLADQLHVERTGSDVIHLASFGSSSQSVQHMDVGTVYLKTDTNELLPLEVLIVPTIAVPLNNCIHKAAVNLPYLRGLKLAHPVTADDIFEISVLIGADYFWKIVQNRVVRGDGPTAVKSKVGYLLSGPLSQSCAFDQRNHVMNIVTTPPEQCDLERFWKLESLGVNDNELSVGGSLESYKKNCITFQEGRYVAKLPWKSEHVPLPTNYEITKKRTEATVHHLSRDPSLLKKYGDIIAEQEKRGFVERVSEQKRTLENVHYIPHHAVRKESSTTPIRIVFDCSCRQSRDQPSLNDCLESTPPEINDLTDVLVRFRLNPYGVVTDIEKAFLHVGLHETDRDYTRFLWLSDTDDPNSDLQTYRFKAVLFGATCSPFILNAAIQKHLDENQQSWVSNILRRDLYVDNILSSFPRPEMLMTYFQDARGLMSSAGFNLRSWTSNYIPLREEAERLGIFDQDSMAKVLGMRWNALTDELTYTQKVIPTAEVITKREILKQTSRLYDPLGLLSPVTIRAKILLQELWRNKVDWDGVLPTDTHRVWTQLAEDLNVAMETTFPRYYFRQTQDSNPEQADMMLHVFVDASTQAYGAVVYLCTKRCSSFVIAKNRVAPLKKITLPRLELMAAVIGARLAHNVQRVIACKTTVFWSDSQIVLHWLAASNSLPRFVQNRVSQIRELAGNSTWRYCSTKDNPADLQTRGLSATSFQENNLWKSGPQWLLDEANWPSWTAQRCVTMATQIDIQPPEAAPLTFSHEAGIHKIISIEDYSKYRRLLRVTAYVNRFTQNARTVQGKRKCGVLTVDELQQAEILWLRSSQTTQFDDEIREIESRKTHKCRSSVVRQLRLFLDDGKLLRCGGRIHNAPVEENTKFPILLPTKHTLTKLIVQDIHDRLLHSGENATITQLRQKYWIPRIRQCVRSVLRKCVVCRRVSSRAYTAPEPPPLMKYRVEDTIPFTVTGVDFTGALYVKNKFGVETKAYICLFTCASTRAIHLEVVTDLSEDTFLKAFRRFVSRKSLPSLMVSDNAMSFQAASNHLRQLTNSTSLQENLSHRGTQWQFIPKRAPWFGGWWERLVGLTKTTLKKALGRAYVCLDELQTITTEIEAIINDRPLTYVSSDQSDIQPLTPAHLLYGRKIITVPYQHLETPNVAMEADHVTLTRRAKLRQTLIQHFRDRWRREYLTSLREYQQTRHRTCNKQTIREGDVVQIFDENPRVLWKLAIIDELVKGNDGMIRSAKLRTKGGTTNRPITKLYPLEVIHERRDDCVMD